jgi:hypothetical protein
MVYDQGFEITIPDRMDPSRVRTYFQFMSYSQSGGAVTTDCGASLREYGWVHDVPAPGAPPTNWACYVATRQGAPRVRRDAVAAHGPGRLLGVPRSATWLADRPRAVADARPDAVKYAGLPAAFDWGNVSETSYLEPMRDQLTCGSCFAFAGTSSACTHASAACTTCHAHMHNMHMHATRTHATSTRTHAHARRDCCRTAVMRADVT